MEEAHYCSTLPCLRWNSEIQAQARSVIWRYLIVEPVLRHVQCQREEGEEKAPKVQSSMTDVLVGKELEDTRSEKRTSIASPRL